MTDRHLRLQHGEEMLKDIGLHKELKPDVIVERYLDAKYYHYDPEDIYESSDYNVNAKYLAESDKVVTLNSTETEGCSANASLNDNFQELEKTVPEWDQDTQVIHPKWLEHHQLGSRMSSVYGRSRQ